MMLLGQSAQVAVSLVEILKPGLLQPEESLFYKTAASIFSTGVSFKVANYSYYAGLGIA